ncbi:hypothetical protein WBG99_21290 [Streptomyces sp. TG1A-60]|uniref:hypothetical protein n=1 Tax=Streptomyces sp. TG1A-60 TaxID=3129111 RepID=UPI0030CA7FFC
MAWDEWEQLKANALARQQDRMQLNSAGGGGSAAAADLKTNASGKTAAVKALREDIRPGTDKAGVHAEENSAAVVREFAGWDTGSGLKDAHREWELQVANLKNRLETDQTALEQTKRGFEFIDLDVRSGIARLDAGADPRRDA